MNEIEKARMASFYDEIITEKNKIIIRLHKRINELDATCTEKTIEELRSEFEETETFVNLKNCFDVYYKNLGGYHYVNGGDCSFYLNGAFAMFQ